LGLIKKRISKDGKKKEWILIFEKQLDRINRIVRIERPSAEGPLAAGEKNPVNPVDPACPMESFYLIPSGSKK
jgi:hypothetical protein